MLGLKDLSCWICSETWVWFDDDFYCSAGRLSALDIVSRFH